MRGFVNILAVTLIAATTIIGGLGFVVHWQDNSIEEMENRITILEQEPPRFGSTKFKDAGLLGAITSSGNFPTSVNNFEDGDIINAGDWNNIEYAIGVTSLPTNSSTPTNSLNWRLSAATSGDPGHYHTLSDQSSVTGTTPIALGGTAASSFSQGIVFASGTEAMTTLQATRSGQLAMSSGTDWVVGGLIEGTNMTITTSTTGEITFAASATELPTSTWAIPEYTGLWTGTTSQSFTSNFYSWAYYVPTKITVNKIGFHVNSVSTPSTMDIAVYSHDGQNRIINTTTGNIGTAGATTTSISATTLNPGIYYVGFVLNGGTITFNLYDTLDSPLERISGEPQPSIGGLVETDPPETIDVTSETQEGVNALIIRFDN